MARQCPNCNTKFKKSELGKLKHHTNAYNDQSLYVMCHCCGRFFVTNALSSMLYLVLAVFSGLMSFTCSFFLKQGVWGIIFGVLNVLMLVFRGQIHQYMPVVDVSDTDL